MPVMTSRSKVHHHDHGIAFGNVERHVEHEQRVVQAGAALDGMSLKGVWESFNV